MSNSNLPPSMSSSDIPGNHKLEPPNDDEKYCPTCDDNVVPKPIMDTLNPEELLISLNCPICGYEFKL